MSGYGPERRERAVVLSFDNLGEAADLERGTWPADEPLGRHPAVVEVLPALLDELDALDLRATFFVEAINCELNPQAVGEIVIRGHEVGVHGWRHEQWGEMEPDRERATLERATGAYMGLGIVPYGFRPPGGELTGQSEDLLRGLGYRWCSPAGEEYVARDGFAYVPFAWELVDAFHLMDSFRELRVTRGAPARAVAPEVLAERLTERVGGGEAIETVILHPFLMLDAAWWTGARRVLAFLAALRDDGGAWVVGGGTFADWLVGSA